MKKPRVFEGVDVDAVTPHDLHISSDDELVRLAARTLAELESRYLGASHRKELIHALWPLLLRLESQSA